MQHVNAWALQDGLHWSGSTKKNSGGRGGNQLLLGVLRFAILVMCSLKLIKLNGTHMKKRIKTENIL